MLWSRRWRSPHCSPSREAWDHEAENCSIADAMPEISTARIRTSRADREKLGDFNAAKAMPRSLGSPKTSTLVISTRGTVIRGIEVADKFRATKRTKFALRSDRSFHRPCDITFMISIKLLRPNSIREDSRALTVTPTNRHTHTHTHAWISLHREKKVFVTYDCSEKQYLADNNWNMCRICIIAYWRNYFRKNTYRRENYLCRRFCCSGSDNNFICTFLPLLFRWINKIIWLASEVAAILWRLVIVSSEPTQFTSSVLNRM